MESQGVSLEQLLELVERAAGGDRRLLVQLFRVMQQLAHNPSATPEDRELGRLLSLVLMGDRSPDLSALPPDIAAEVSGLIARLKGSASSLQPSPS